MTSIADVPEPPALPPPGDHGGDAARVAAMLGFDPAQMVDLSASMNPSAPDVAGLLQRLLARDQRIVSRYPDPADAEDLLAVAIGVDPARLVMTNGGAEAIALVAAEMPIGYVQEPEFSLYRRHLQRLEPGAPQWRSNPSNPLGLLAIADQHCDVWDEAFFPLATGRWTRGDDDSWRLGSLTKLWACPGLRLGYAIAPDAERATLLRHRRPRWSVNGLALAALPELLAATDLVGWQQMLCRLRSEFVEHLAALGFAASPTDANWVMVAAPGLREHLARRGVMVRDCTSFGLPGVHRVAVPSPGEMDHVLSAFAHSPDPLHSPLSSPG